MEDRLLRLLRFLNRVTICFTILVFSVLIPGGFLEGAERECSSFFSLSTNGISYITLWQMLAAAFVTMGFQWLICESKLLTKLMDIYKTVIVLVGEFLIAVVFALLFEWFPIHMLSAWGMFVGLFLLCTSISTFIMVMKTKRESQIYDQRLAEYKKNREGKENES